jgi:hypothetical protein
VQPSTHAPLEQTVPAGQVCVHDASKHAPEVVSHDSGEEHVTPPHVAQPAKQSPLLQTSPDAHVTP